MTTETTETKQNEQKESKKVNKETKSKGEAPETKETKAKGDAKKAETKAKADGEGKAAPSKPSVASNPLVLGFEYEFLPLNAEDAAAGVIEIAPGDLIMGKLDARATVLADDDELIASVRANGLIQNPLVTYVRHIKTGKTGYLIVAGRRRVRAAIKAGLKAIKVNVRQIRDLKEFLILAGQENWKRENLTFWDKYVLLTNLMESGLKQSELKDVLNVTEGNISQILKIRTLDARVIKLVQEGTHEPFKSSAASMVRHLGRITDPETQVAIATNAIKDKLEPGDVEIVCTRWLDRKKAREDAEKNSSGKGESEGKGKSLRLPEELKAKDIALRGKADIAALLNLYRPNLAKLRASERATPESIAKAQGRVEGLMLAAGLKDMPKSLTDDGDEE